MGLSRLISAWTAVGVFLLPLYLWSSGGVQLAHFVLAVSAAAVILVNGFRIDTPGRLLVLLAAVITAREGVAAAHGASVESILPIFYTGFCCLIYLAMRIWLADYKSWRFLIVGLFFATLLAVAGVLVMGYGATVDFDGGRSVGTFNNPNQLGYFSVCLFSLLALLYLRGRISLFWLLLFIAASIFLAIASLSKAAMVACAAGIFFIWFRVGRTQKSVYLGAAVACCILLALGVMLSSGLLDDYRFVRRLAGIGQQDDDSLAGRGYGVLFDVNATEFLFGYGSQAVRAIVGHEVHSTIGSYFANYGIVGGLLFSAFIILWLKRVYAIFGFVGLMSICMPPMLYGITHNGSRFTIFWLLVAGCMVSTRVVGPAAVEEKAFGHPFLIRR